MTSFLEDYGWQAFYANAFTPFAQAGYSAGRVVAEYQHLYDLITKQGPVLGQVSGKFRFQAEARGDFPAVGDWVVYEKPPGSEQAIIQGILPRKSVFSRKAVAGVTEEQIVAANVDVLFLVSALNQDFNLRRLERYLTLAHRSGAETVVVLNKADLCEDLGDKLAQVREIAMAQPIFAISAMSNQGLDPLRSFLQPGVTVALLGSSGVGKSTLLNALYGAEIQKVNTIREDDAKGRHTTTHRQLFQLPSGGLILDTPGMRELQLWDAAEGIEQTFEDLHDLFAACRYRNCAHEQEPGCAVQTALATGDLDDGRWRNYLKLQREEAWVERRQNQQEKLNTKRRWKQITKALKKQSKEKWL